jgi:DNA modification methylase
MQIIPIPAVNLAPNRQRQVFDEKALQELADSIAQNGLFHPVVVRSTAEGFYLVAGERRLIAQKMLHEFGTEYKFDNQVVPLGHIPVTMLGELSILAAEEAELDENLKRKDLTWQEHASALERLKNLREAQAKEAGASHTISELAVEVVGRADGWYGDNIRKELIVAKHLNNPIVSKAKTMDEAFKLLKKQENTERSTALAATVGKTFTKELHKIFNVDCLTWMADYIKEGSERFDVILTDPPYGMGANNFSDGGGKFSGITHIYEDSYESWQKLMRVWCELSFNIAKDKAHAYIFCDIDNFHELKLMMQEAGWYVFRTPMINVKTNSGRVPLPESGPRRQYEILLYAIKGKKEVTQIYPDVVSTMADENLTHGAQKPVALYENLLKRSVSAGDLVLDSFAGTGTIFPACHSHLCRAVGLEQSQEYFGIALERLQKLDAQTSLF